MNKTNKHFNRCKLTIFRGMVASGGYPLLQTSTKGTLDSYQTLTEVQHHSSSLFIQLSLTVMTLTCRNPTTGHSHRSLH